jgi:hypothetical protein
MKALLRGISQVLFVIAGLFFFFGGLAINALTKTDRMPAEMRHRLGFRFWNLWNGGEKRVG